MRAALGDSVFFILMGVLALFLQVISNQKFLGYLLLIVGLLAQITLAMIGYEHNLYIFGGSPELRYSDMDGFGPRLEPWAWFNLYWGLASALLICATASTGLPACITVTSVGGAAKSRSHTSWRIVWKCHRRLPVLASSATTLLPNRLSPGRCPP